jgi:hypothetical protein
MSRTIRESAVVMRIDRAARTVVLEGADGAARTVHVPSGVKGFASLKPGDHVDIEYREAMALSMLPPGSKPSISEKTTSVQGGSGQASAGQEIAVSAVIVSVDAAANKVTFKGPDGQTETVTVQDPALQNKLPTLKPGQVVQMVYTEAIAASIHPSSGAK